MAETRMVTKTTGRKTAGKSKAAKKTKAAPKKKTRRGSPEAVEKRRVARQLNALLSGESTGKKLDGRTEKKRQRMIATLKGEKGPKLKPMERVQMASELMGMGETMASLKKHGVKTDKVAQSDETLELVERTQSIYGFEPSAWRILGIRLDDEGKLPTKKKRTTKKRRG